MTRPSALIDRDSWLPFVGLLFFCGIALVLSIPGPRSVRDLGQVEHFARTVGFDVTRLYLDAYILCFGLLGLRLGSVSAERRESGRGAVLRLVQRVLLGQLLCLPYLVLARTLFPGRDTGLVLVVLFATLISSLCAVLHWRIEEPGDAPHRPFTGYAIFLGVTFASFVEVPLLSPVGAGRVLFEGTGAGEAIAAFAAPPALLSALFYLTSRLRGLAHG